MAGRAVAHAAHAGPLRSLAPLAESSFVSLELLGPAGAALLDMFTRCRRLTVITGAGISTSSGIPDYRSPGRPPYKPLNHAAYMSDELTRRRYWARSFMGYDRMAAVLPNRGHVALAEIEQERSSIRQIITQNVDRLHHRAGSTAVLELHGTIHVVECLACHARFPRADVQEWMRGGNAAWLGEYSAAASQRPDGDVELPPQSYAHFHVPMCPHCARESLKPMVVFHGGSVPPAVTSAASAAVAESDGLLVVGSTLSTWSALRLVKAFVDRAKGAADVAAAARTGLASAIGVGDGSVTAMVGSVSDMPFGIINFGETRADDLARFKIQAHTSAVLAAVREALR